MSPRSYYGLRALLMVNACLLLLGLVRVTFVKWQDEPDGGNKHPVIRGVMAHIEHTQINHFIRGTANCTCPTSRPPAQQQSKTLPPSEPLSTGLDDDQVVEYPDKIGEDFDNSKEFQVPNIVHYIWFNTEPRPLQFHQMISILSAHKILNPDVIYFHTNVEPTGPYWDKLRSLPKMKVMYRDPPTKLFGETVKEPFFYTSHSNVDRVNILMEYGGIYLDFDVLVTSPFDDLRRHVCSVGLETEKQVCGSVIVCSKKSVFLLLWLNSYLDDYRTEEWAYNTGKVPFKLAQRYPHLVNVEKTRINRPNFKELDKIWGTTRFDWQKNYAVHIWYRLWKDRSSYFKGVEPNPENIKTWNSTFGEIARSILYGTKDRISADSFFH